MIVVTGGAGFIAHGIIQRLLELGKTILAIDNLAGGSLENIAPMRAKRNFAFAQADLADLEAYRQTLAANVELGPVTDVWHMAANSDIPAGLRDNNIDLRDTFITTFNTLQIMEEQGARRLIFASSSAIYGDLQDKILSEDSGPLLPISNYGAMKLASEAVITAAAEKFLERALLFRFPNVVGVPATHGVILDFVRRLRINGTRLEVLGDGTQRKPYLHVSDLVDAIFAIEARSLSKVDVFNIGPEDSGVTVRQIAEETIAVVAPGAELRFGVGDKGWVGDVPRFRYSIEKLRSLGWKPKLSSLDAARRAIREIARQEGAV